MSCNNENFVKQRKLSQFQLFIAPLRLALKREPRSQKSKSAAKGAELLTFDTTLKSESPCIIDAREMPSLSFVLREAEHYALQTLPFFMRSKRCKSDCYLAHALQSFLRVFFNSNPGRLQLLILPQFQEDSFRIFTEETFNKPYMIIDINNKMCMY